MLSVCVVQVQDVRAKQHFREPQNPYLPNGVQHVPVLEYPEQFVVCGDFVEVCTLLIGEKQIWFPYRVQHGRVQVQRVVRVLSVGQAGVVPLLAEEDVHTVILHAHTQS